MASTGGARDLLKRKRTKDEGLGFNPLDVQTVETKNMHWFKWDSSEVYRFDP
jgi:hypothetical protein